MGEEQKVEVGGIEHEDHEADELTSTGIIGLKGYNERLCKNLYKFVYAEMESNFVPDYKSIEQIEKETNEIKEERQFNEYEIMFMFMSKGEIRGTIGVKWAGDDSVKFKKFYVNEKYRNKGIGTRLIETAINYVISNCACNTIKVSAGSQLKDAIIMYHSKGFKNIETDERGNETILKMELKLR